MRVVREVLIEKALCALGEAIEVCCREPIIPDGALRFSLAYLFAVGDSGREPFDAFWKAVQLPNSERAWCAAGRYKRAAELNASFKSIAAAAGADDAMLKRVRAVAYQRYRRR